MVNPEKSTATITALILLVALQSLGLVGLCRGQGPKEPCRPTNGEYEVFKKVSESEEIGYVVFTVSIEGTDEEVILTSDNNEYFAFNSSSRKVVVNGTIDAEGFNIQTVRVFCRERLNGRSSTITMTIQVLDANDNAPEFTSPVYNITIGEMTPVDTVLYTNIRAEDLDATPDHNIIYYSIVDGPYMHYFLLADPLRPDLTLLQELDYETLPEFSFTIMAMDQSKGGLVQYNSTCEVRVKVKDEDDLYPVFSSFVYRGVITDTNSVGTGITITPPIEAHDPDLTLAARVIYSFHGPNQDILEIDPDTGAVTLAERPTAGEVYLLLQATQEDNPSRYGVALLEIQIQGTNVNAPKFAREDFTVVVTEVFPVGEVVTGVIATDEDPGTEITYSLVDASETFNIEAKSGDVILKKPLDFAARPEFVLTLTASDGTLDTSTTMTISVRGINKQPPHILTSDLNVTAERKKGGDIVAINASDSDEGSVLTFRLLNLQDQFSIDPQGVITIAAEPKDLPLDTYQLAVVVSDGGQPSYESAAVVTVRFPPLIEAVPVIMADSDSLVPIVLGVVAAIFLIIIILLVVYLLRRRSRDKEYLDRVRKQQPGHGPKVLTFRQKQATLGRKAAERINIDLHEVDDGQTSVQGENDLSFQENPLNSGSSKGSYFNFGQVYLESDPDIMPANDIQVETSVVPFDMQLNDNNNNDQIYNTSQCSVDSEDYSQVEKNTMATFYRNGSLSTFRDSSGSEMSLNVSPTESSDSKKVLMPGSLARTRVPEENGGVWDRNGTCSIPTITNMPNLDPDTSAVPTAQKQELTVYF